MVGYPASNGKQLEDTKASFVYQGWSPQVSQAFHYEAQGSELIPYYWFLHLEEPDGTLLKDDLRSCGVLYDDSTPDNSLVNPDQLGLSTFVWAEFKLS